MAAKIKKGDRVVVLAGKDKGRQGAVLKVLPKESRVLVEGLNIVQRHTRPTQGDPQGGHQEQGSGAAHLQRRHRRSQVRRRDPRRLPHRRRQEGAVRQEIRRGDQWLMRKLTNRG